MRIGDLIRELEGLDPNTEVRLATQEHWPFEHALDGTYLRPAAKQLKPQEEVDAMTDAQRERYDEECEAGVYADLDDPTCEELREPIVYLIEGRQLRYLPGIVKDGVGW